MASTKQKALPGTYTVEVYRQGPGEGKPRYDRFEVPVQHPGMTVLEALLYIKENLDPTLAVRYSCRMAVCGSCGMYVNGKGVLACHTRLAEFPSGKIRVSPMPNYPVVKDLMTDMSEFFTHHREVKPYIINPEMRAEIERPTREFLQTPEEVEEYLQFSYCIKCGLCVSACPTVASDPDFLGPQALMTVTRYNRDTRDGGWTYRLEVVDRPHGVWNCHFAGACTEVCPKGVDPALAIQFLKREAVVHGLGLDRLPFWPKRKQAPLAPPPKPARRKGIPAPPPRTVPES